jgi:hydrogenase expression/formation protein HypE
MKGSSYHIKAVLFDFDGTLTRSGALDFGAIRKALGCPQGVPILEFIKTLESGQVRQSAQTLLDRFELKGARDSIPNAGAQEVVVWLKRQGVAVGVLTRNSRTSVIRALENFDSIGAEDFDLMITRDDHPAPKPSGEGVLWAARRLGISAGEILVVGDFIFDTQAGRAAGALTALLDPHRDERLQAASCDFRIDSLDQVADIVRTGGLPSRRRSSS